LEKDYGYFRPIVREIVERYLDCGNPRSGFALMIRYRLMRTDRNGRQYPLSELPRGTPVDIFLQDAWLLPDVPRQAPGGVGGVGEGVASPLIKSIISRIIIPHY